MKDDAQGQPVPGSQPAYAMPMIDPVDATCTLDRAGVHGKYHGVSLAQAHHFRPRLHAGPLLGHDELATREIQAGLRKKDGNLQGKDVLAVEVLMQAIVVSLSVTEQERRRTYLPCRMAAPDEIRMDGGNLAAKPIASCHRLATGARRG